MIPLILIIAGILAVAVDMPYKELASGKHWDCDKIRHMEVDLKTTKDALDAVSYCLNDPMKDDTKNAYGETIDWKTGRWTR